MSHERVQQQLRALSGEPEPGTDTASMVRALDRNTEAVRRNTEVLELVTAMLEKKRSEV
jgi:hypothetical protein